MSKVISEGMNKGLKVNPEWLWQECLKCGTKFKEKHYGDGTLIKVDEAEWSENVPTGRSG